VGTRLTLTSTFHLSKECFYDIKLVAELAETVKTGVANKSIFALPRDLLPWRWLDLVACLAVQEHEAANEHAANGHPCGVGYEGGLCDCMQCNG
jgi:hypothetical protein